MKNNEKELINLASNGDKKAFCELISLHRSKLRSFAVSIAYGNGTLADDILQEALVKAFLSIKNYELRGSFTTWLWRIIKNEFINYLRDPANKLDYLSVNEESAEAELSAGEDSESEMIRSDIKKEVHRLISLLPMKLRVAVVLIDIQELNYEDASDILEISLTAMKSRVFKGRKKLIELVNEKKDPKQLSSSKNRCIKESGED